MICTIRKTFIMHCGTAVSHPRQKFVHEVMNFHGLFMNVHENA